MTYILVAVYDLGVVGFGLAQLSHGLTHLCVASYCGSGVTDVEGGEALGYRYVRVYVWSGKFDSDEFNVYMAHPLFAHTPLLQDIFAALGGSK